MSKNLPILGTSANKSGC